MRTAADVTLVVVDDDAVEVEALRRGLRRLGFAWGVRVFPDGVQALTALRGGAGDPVREPFLVLLDLDLPRMGGLELLAALRDDPELARAAVFVLTTSDAPEDLRAASRLGAEAYFVKSHAGDDYVDALGALQRSLAGRGAP